jgi:hypothetical protein
MTIKSPDHFLSVTDSVRFLRVNQGIGSPSSMKSFHPKLFVQVGNNLLWRGPQGSRKSASYCMWVPIEAITENFMGTSGRWSSRASLHRKDLLTLAELSPPKRRLEFSSCQPRGKHFVCDQRLSRVRMPSLTRN